jgi:hypothetical protein
MIVGTLFTLFVVPVFYQLIAADHRVRQDAVVGNAVAEPVAG